MVKRPHLALVPAYGIGPLARRPSRRMVTVVALAVGVVALLYLAARETSLFAVREVEISGAPPWVRAEVEKAAKAYVGSSLVALDGDELRRTLEAVPSVSSLRFDRAFPHTLRLRVTPERPVAVARAGSTSWLVSARGRVVGPLERGHAAELPRIRVPTDASLAPGDLVEDRQALLALRALVRVPARFPVEVKAARANEGALVLKVGGGTELRLGERRELRLKLAVAERVLRLLSAPERASLAYIDLTVPDRPVAAEKPQVSG